MCIVLDKQYPQHEPYLGKFNGEDRWHCQRCGQWLDEVSVRKIPMEGFQSHNLEP